jgi:hypothetical protein
MQEACRPLTPSESAKLSRVPIVGMRFHGDAIRLIDKIKSESSSLRQCLYLVPEVGNQYDKNAVMLHDGKRKLGYVSREFASTIRPVLEQWKRQNEDNQTGDDVVVCTLVNSGWNSHESTTFVTGIFRVNERVARKFSDTHRKEI